MTWTDLVREIWGPCSDDDVEVLLWSCTAFPFAGEEHIKKQLRDIKEKSNGNVGKAWQIADKETEAAMQNTKEDLTK